MTGPIKGTPPETMKAVVYRGPDDLRLETLPVPEIQPGELLVKVAVCGVCPTDIKKIHYGTVPPPRVSGHETAGTIVKIAGRSRNFRVGERVALHHHVPCLRCHFCWHGAYAQCAAYKRTGITAGFDPAGGGYAQYVRVMPFVLPGVVKIPARNTFRSASSHASSGMLGFSRRMASRKRSTSTTSPNEFRSAAGSPGARCGPWPMT